MLRAGTVAELALVLASTATLANAQSNSVGVGTRISRGLVSFPDGGSISATQLYIAGASRETVTERPYSAEMVEGGADLQQARQRATLYRDSQGRTRTDTEIIPLGGAVEGSLSNFTEIIDPIAGFQYLLDPRDKTALRTAWPPVHKPASMTVARTTPGVSTPTTPPAPAPQITTESLGTQTIEGVLAVGTRTTRTSWVEGMPSTATSAQ